MKVLVMGGTRMLGLHTVAELVHRDHEVIVFNRGRTPGSLPAGVRAIRGDRDVAAELVQIASERPEGIVDFSAFTARQTELLLDVAPEVPRYVHCSTGAVYRPDPLLPWSEHATPTGPWSLWGTYAHDKLQAEVTIRERRADSDQATTLLRPPYVLAPGNYADREEWVLNRLVDDAEIFVPGDGRSVSHFVSARQVAILAVNALESFADGGLRVFNVAEPSAVASAHGFVDLCAEIVGKPARVRSVPRAEGSFDRDNAVFPFPGENYLLDTRAAQAAGIQPPAETLPAMLLAAFEYLMAHPERRAWTRSSAEQALLHAVS